MKNFTKQNFKTNPLWIRLLIMAFMLLLGSSSAWGKTIYFKANGSNNWAADNAVIQISIGSNTSWKKMTSLGNGMYSYEANNGATVYFARGASEGSTWNVTGKLTVPSDKNLFTPNGWSNCAGDWSTYTPPTKIPSGTKLYFDFSSATTWGAGHYLSIVGSSNTSHSANNSNTSGAGSYTPKSDAWVELTKECDGIYSYTTTSDITTGISLWSTDESTYDQVWQTDVILNIKAADFDKTKTCYTLSSTSTNHSGRQTDCFGGSWGSTIPVCCTPANVSISEWNVPATLCTNSSGTFKYTAATGASVTWKMLQSNNNYTITQSNGTVTITYNGTSTINSNNLLYSVSGTNICPETDKESGKTISGAAIPSISASTSRTQSICPGDKATLTVTSGKGTYTWIKTNEGENISDTDNSVQVGTAGTYTVTATDGNNCSSNAVEFTVTVKELQGQPVFDNASETVCESTAFNLPATDDKGATLVWYTSNGASQDASVSAGITTQTVYYAAIAATNDKCETASNNRTAYTVNVDSKSALALTEENPTICQGSSIVLSDYVDSNSSTGTVKWYSNSARTEEITNPTEARTPQSSPTYYYARATSGVCSSVDKTLTVTLSPQPAITLKAAPTICNGATIAFPDYVDNNNTIGTVSWYLDEDRTQSAGVTATPNQTTTYYAKATSGDCTPAKASLKVTVNDKPATPTLSPSTVSLVYPETATLTAGNTTNGLTYTLYNGEIAGESKKSTGSDLDFTVSAAGSYTVQVTNDCGTSPSAAVTVTVCTPQTNEFRHANSSYTQLANQPTYYPGDKAYFVSTITCCLTGNWSANLDKGEEGWWTGLTGGTPNFSMTLTRAGEFTITNMATNGCTDTKDVKVNLDFTVTALAEVTDAEGTASGADIALTWKHSANHTKVMVVRYPTAGTETIPAGGQSYSAGNTLGEGKVVYVGTAESVTDTNLTAGAGYKYYFYTVNNNYYSEGVVLNMSSCPIPAKPSLSSTAITACNGECTAQGYITIGNMGDYKDDTYTFKLGNSKVTPDENGRLGINSTAYTQYTVTVTNSCGNSSNAQVDIAINDNKPTITGATYTQPGKSNAITLTAANGILADWSVDNGGDLSKTSKSNTTEFSAEENGTYIITADNKGCTDTHVVTVSDAFYVYMRQPKKGETAYNNFYYPTQNPTQGGDLFYKEYASIPPAEGYTDYNQGGRAHDVILTDCDGYVWYGFKASAQLIDGTNYFTVHAPNKNGYDGWFTHTDITKPGKMTGDIYYIMGTEGNGNSGWKIEEASAPYSGPVVHALGSTTLGTDKFAALYVTDCSGKEIDAYQWEYCRTEDGTYQPYSSVCSYTFEKKDVVKTENSNAGQTNNIRPSEFGYYRCKVTYTDGNTATSATEHILGSYSRSFTSTIPVLVVNTGSKDFPSCPVENETASKHADKMKKKLSVDVKIYDGTTLVYDRKARMAYRGSSSLNFLKKSYAFCPGDANCGDADKGPDYVKTAKLNMLDIGVACDKDWVLYAAAADPSMLRNRMVFETYQAMRPGEWGVKSRYVELIINGEYKGVYLMMDKITQNEKRVNVEWSVKDETKRGFILKFDKTDVVDRSKDYPDGDEKTFLSKYSGKHNIGTYDATNDQAFEIEYPEKGDIEDEGGNWYDVINFIQGMINNFETALSAGEYQKVQQIIDYESWADWFILSEYTKNVDAFRASCVFVYDGTKLKATPLWDQELSFNNQSVHANRTPDDPNNKGCENVTGLLIKNDKVYSDSFAAPFWFTGKLAGGKGTEKLAAKTFTGALLNDPCFVQMVKNRWEAHKTGALSNASLTALITNYEKELTSTVLTREANFWNGKSRNTLSCPWPGHNTGYHDDSYADAKADITAWISDNTSENGTNRRAGLSKAIDALKGTGLDIAIKPASIQTTPWVPVVIQVQNETGYDYTLTYTDGELDKQPNIIIEKSGDTYKYHIPRPWPAGDEQVEDERVDINYVIKATLQVGEGNNQCGSTGELPSATATITLKDEDNDGCK